MLFRVVSTIPGALVATYRSEDRVQIVVPFTTEELRANPGDTFVYRVRTRASRKRTSPDSNTVSVHIFPVAERIISLQATVTESAIELNWQAPTRTSAGDPLSAISEYRVYRGELDPASADAAAKDISQARWKSPLALLASSPTSTYRDTLFDFGKMYLYVVRTVISPAGGPALESSDSTPAILSPRDIFPPAIPQGLVAAVIVGSPTNAPEVDLSWSINVETDLSGYRVSALESLALKPNLAAAVALVLFAAVPVVRFLRLPGHLLASSLIAWSILALTYRLLSIYFWGLPARYSAVQILTLGSVLYMILATLSWIGTCIWRARESDVSHSDRHVS